MMKELPLPVFFDASSSFKKRAHLELTYRCNLSCLHCFCKGSEHPARNELTAGQWSALLLKLRRSGCLWLTLSGGEPLLRPDFRRIYGTARKLGFIITVFTNATLCDRQLVNFLSRNPPFSVEVTLNGCIRRTYESITCVKGSFRKALDGIRRLVQAQIPLIIKSNCMLPNYAELGSIKALVEPLVGRPAGRGYRFRFDPMIYPRLNGDPAPTKLRLSYPQLCEVRKQDPQIWQEYRRELHHPPAGLNRDPSFLYHCDAWRTQVYVNPLGKMRFCVFSDAYGGDLLRHRAASVWERMGEQIAAARYVSRSACRECSLRSICYHCPARARLETGDQEAPVDYFCRLARGYQAHRQELREKGEG